MMSDKENFSIFFCSSEMCIVAAVTLSSLQALLLPLLLSLLCCCSCCNCCCCSEVLATLEFLNHHLQISLLAPSDMKESTRSPFTRVNKQTLFGHKFFFCCCLFFFQFAPLSDIRCWGCEKSWVFFFEIMFLVGFPSVCLVCLCCKMRVTYVRFHVCILWLAKKLWGLNLMCFWFYASISSLCRRISRTFLWELECLWGM